MLTELSQLRELLDRSHEPKKMILAAAEDAHSLNAVFNAASEKIVRPILVGDRDKTFGMAEILNLDISKFEFIEAKNPVDAVTISVKMVHDKKADLLMKGKVGSSDMMRCILNKDYGLRMGKLLSHFAYFEVETYHKLIAVTDVAMNIAPNLTEKIQILNNSVKILNNLGIAKPKVAVLGAVEKVNTEMVATLDAALLSKMNQRDQILNCIVDGPLAFDNAVSFESAKHKEIKSDVAGDTDLLLMPDIEVGNVLYKSLVFFAKAKVASMIVGASAPIVLTSRSDSEQAKFDSILLAAVAAENGGKS
ncbi:MAG: phosphate butyryltransferase [Bacteroidetes bacterium]|nr:MAG: phosphate butyryltransferase [Bacteroidota bacterium]RLD71902.1 MAG: phosphate butyryltransferase [Bacteroidota bacterium]RLD93753.1 MAG: phosphate butyryltransferase [Bacteroidota bacterium]